MLYTMFVSYMESEDLYTCIGDQNHGVAFTILAGNPDLAVYGYDKKHKCWIWFVPLDSAAVGEVYQPLTVLGSLPQLKQSDERLIKVLNEHLEDWNASKF